MRLLIQLSENLIERGHVHSSAIKSWCALVEGSFKDYIRKLDAYRYGLEERLGLRGATATADATQPQPGDRSSDSSLESKLSGKDSVPSSSSTPVGEPTTSSLPSPTVAKSAVPMAVLTDAQQELRRKTSRKKEFIMAELLQTERTYVKDLEVSQLYTNTINYATSTLICARHSNLRASRRVLRNNDHVFAIYNGFLFDLRCRSV